jgi:hypothetical protein
LPSPESLVDGWYQKYLKRRPDYAAGGWVVALRRGTAPQQVLAGILASPEYYQLSGGDDWHYVYSLYYGMTGRPPTKREVHYWMGRLLHHSRDEVAYQLINRYPVDMPAQGLEDYDFRRPFDRYRN